MQNQLISDFGSELQQWFLNLSLAWQIQHVSAF